MHIIDKLTSEKKLVKGKKYLCKIEHDKFGNPHWIELVYVNEDDCSFRTCDDNLELSYSINIIDILLQPVESMKQQLADLENKISILSKVDRAEIDMSLQQAFNREHSKAEGQKIQIHVLSKKVSDKDAEIKRLRDLLLKAERNLKYKAHQQYVLVKQPDGTANNEPVPTLDKILHDEIAEALGAK